MVNLENKQFIDIIEVDFVLSVFFSLNNERLDNKNFILQEETIKIKNTSPTD